MSTTLKSIGFLGAILFSCLYALTFGMPDAIEQSAKGFIKMQIAMEVEEKYFAIKSSTFAEKTQALASKFGMDHKEIISDLERDLPNRIAEKIASMCGYDCEKKKALAASITKGYLDRLKGIEIAQQQLGDIIKGKYLEIVENLRLDLRIFLGTNAACFFILLLISFLKPRAIQHLFLPGLLLFVATIASTSIYLFGQDWFYTILYNDYMGYGYIGYLALILGFLIDIAFNRARMTTEIINALANAVGSVLSVLPC